MIPMTWYLGVPHFSTLAATYQTGSYVININILLGFVLI